MKPAKYSICTKWMLSLQNTNNNCYYIVHLYSPSNNKIVSNALDAYILTKQECFEARLNEVTETELRTFWLYYNFCYFKYLLYIITRYVLIFWGDSRSSFAMHLCGTSWCNFSTTGFQLYSSCFQQMGSFCWNSILLLVSANLKLAPTETTAVSGQLFISVKLPHRTCSTFVGNRRSLPDVAKPSVDVGEWMYRSFV